MLRLETGPHGPFLLVFYDQYMCGRFTQSSRADVYERLYGVPCPFEIVPRFNVAPSQPVLALRNGDNGWEFAVLTWGLVPHWAHDPAAVQRPINARAETLVERPIFRDAFKYRRALVPAEIFYEWRRERGRAVPFAFRRREGLPFSVAAVWERWAGRGQAIESLSLIVGPANGRVAPIHDRMPVIIPAERFSEWLDPATPLARLRQLLVPYPAADTECFQVSSAVNNTRNEGADLVRPSTGE